MVVAVEDQAWESRPGAGPARPVLQQNAPNPFNASTVIAAPSARRTWLPRPCASTTCQGRWCENCRSTPPGAGEHRLTWDGRDELGRVAASGVYVYRLETREWAVHRRMLLLR